MQDAGPDTPAPTPAEPPAADPAQAPAPAPAAAVPAPRTKPRARRAEPAARPGPADRPAPHPGGDRLVTLVLAGLSALPPLSMDMYLPALPQVTGSLHASAATVQLTLTTCLAGLAAGQLVVGPLSDRWGRRRPLLAGMALYTLATALCAFAPSAGLLIAFRLVQGLAGAAGVVIARAVVRDMFDGDAMARFFATLQLISGAAPIVAPSIGGQILRVTDWRGVFVVCTAIGALLTAVAWRRLHETLPPERRHAGRMAETFGAMPRLLADRGFTGYVLAGGFAFAALFTYVSASSFVLQDVYGASVQTFSLLFGLNSVGLVAVAQLNGKVLVGRVDLDKVLAAGLVLVTAAAAALVLLTTGVLGRPGLPAVAAALFVLMAAMGLVLTNTNTLALLRTKDAAGAASGLLGTSSFMIGAAISPLASVAGDGTAVPMAVTQLSCAVVACAAFAGLCLRGRRTVEGP